MGCLAHHNVPNTAAITPLNRLPSDLFPAIILAPSVIAVVLLALSIWAYLASRWRWINVLTLVCSVAGLLFLMGETFIGAGTYTSHSFHAREPGLIAMLVALELMYGNYGLVLASATVGSRHRRG